MDKPAYCWALAQGRRLPIQHFIPWKTRYAMNLAAYFQRDWLRQRNMSRYVLLPNKAQEGSQVLEQYVALPSSNLRCSPKGESEVHTEEMSSAQGLEL